MYLYNICAYKQKENILAHPVKNDGYFYDKQQNYRPISLQYKIIIA